MSKKEKKESGPEAVVARWLDRDLTACALELPPAFHVDDIVDEVADLIAGGRNPVLVGPSGVGKTSAIQELVRRAAAGNGPETVRKGRVLQLSIQRAVMSLKRGEAPGAAFQELLEALRRMPGVIPYFRDVHLAGRMNLEAYLVSLAFAGGLVIGEGSSAAVHAMFEETPQLHQQFSIVGVEEPDSERTAQILSAWSAHQEPKGPRFAPDALSEALFLSHRFLARAHLPSKALDLLSRAAMASHGETVTARHVIDRFCHNHRTPRWLVDPSVPLDLAELERSLSSRVLGQGEAVEAVVGTIGSIKAGLADMRRAFAVFLFVGPTGVGKTHVAQILAEQLFGSHRRVIRLNMADFAEQQSAAMLFGNPDDGRTAQLRGLLTLRIAGHPFAVLLLDEFEKAHELVHDRFLQLFDEGSFINAANETISCRSMIIIATSNAGAGVYRSSAFGFTGPMDQAEKDAAIDRALEEKFRFEFLNRFDRIVHFHPLSREHIRAIALRELEALRKRPGLQHRGLTLEIDETVLDWLAAHGYDPDYGARFLRRIIERHVTSALADAIVRESPAEGAVLLLTVRAGRIVARVHQPAPPPEPEVVVAMTPGEAARRLGRAELLDEARRLIESGAPRLATLEARRAERSDLLNRMNGPDFWSRPDQRHDVLSRFRALDVAIRMEARLARPLQRLRDLSAADVPEVEALARAVEAAAESIRRWEEHEAEEGPAAVWIVVSSVDPLHAANEWLEQVAGFELAWCRALHLAAGPVAYEAGEGQVRRLVLEAEGPGASSYLAMEEGVHRLRRRQKADARARVEIVPKSAGAHTDWPGVSIIRPRRGPLNIDGSRRGRIEIAARGLCADFLGPSGAVLSPLLHDLCARWAAAAISEADTARVYETDGTVRDPRTGVSLPKRDVARGRLDEFLDAWRHRQRSLAPTTQAPAIVVVGAAVPATP